MKSGILKVFVCCQKYIHRVEEIKARVEKWNLGNHLIFTGGEEEKELEWHGNEISFTNYELI